MAHEPEEARTDYEEDGGPVKSFLEHLEDLRWTLIKSAAAVAVGMVLCLISGDTIVRILKRPLEHSSLNLPSEAWLLFVLAIRDQPSRALSISPRI